MKKPIPMNSTRRTGLDPVSIRERRREEVSLETRRRRGKPDGESQHPRDEVPVADELLAEDDHVGDRRSYPEIRGEPGDRDEAAPANTAAFSGSDSTSTVNVTASIGSPVSSVT